MRILIEGGSTSGLTSVGVGSTWLVSQVRLRDGVSRTWRGGGDDFELLGSGGDSSSTCSCFGGNALTSLTLTSYESLFLRDKSPAQHLALPVGRSVVTVLSASGLSPARPVDGTASGHLGEEGRRETTAGAAEGLAWDTCHETATC